MCSYIRENKCAITTEVCPYVYYCDKIQAFKPSIDIIIRNNKYEILLWYNSNNKDDENTTYEVSQKNITPKRAYKRIL